MKSARFLPFLIAACLSSSAFADGNELPAEHRHHVEAATKFHPLEHVANLPSALVALCAGREDNFADPGGKWEPTDAISDRSLPSKRLIWAATDGVYYVIHYERGGIAHTFHVLIARIPPNESKPDFVWTVRTQPLADYDAFVTALRSEKLDADAPRKR